MEYLKVWTSFRQDISMLNYEEKGRLFDAMLLYAETGEETDLTGNERFMWPAAKQSIDKTANKADAMRKNGARGGRPKTTQKDIRRQVETEETLFGPVDVDRLIGYVESQMQMSPGNLKEMEDYRNILSDDLVKFAVDEAIAHNAREWSYARKILRNMVKKNVRSVEEAKAVSGSKADNSSASAPGTIYRDGVAYHVDENGDEVRWLDA